MQPCKKNPSLYTLRLFHFAMYLCILVQWPVIPKNDRPNLHHLIYHYYLINCLITINTKKILWIAVIKVSTALLYLELWTFISARYVYEDINDLNCLYLYQFWGNLFTNLKFVTIWSVGFLSIRILKCLKYIDLSVRCTRSDVLCSRVHINYLSFKLPSIQLV